MVWIIPAGIIPVVFLLFAFFYLMIKEKKLSYLIK
jgi:hypothetical protein